MVSTSLHVCSQRTLELRNQLRSPHKLVGLVLEKVDDQPGLVFRRVGLFNSVIESDFEYFRIPSIKAPKLLESSKSGSKHDTSIEHSLDSSASEEKDTSEYDSPQGPLGGSDPSENNILIKASLGDSASG